MEYNGDVFTVSLPPEAARDKEVWRHYDIKSALVFPLSAGGQNLGAVTFNTGTPAKAEKK